MNVLYFLIPLAVSLGLTGLIAFMWSLKSSQYEDLEGAAWRAIQDDDLRAPPPENPQESNGDRPL